MYENFTPGQDIIFRNLTPGQGSSSDFPATPPRMFVNQVPPPGGNLSGQEDCSLYKQWIFKDITQLVMLLLLLELDYHHDIV